MRWCNILASAKSILVIGLPYSPTPDIMVAQPRRISRSEKLRLPGRVGTRRFFIAEPLNKTSRRNVIPIFDYVPTGDNVIVLFKQETKHKSLRLWSSL